MATTVVSGGKQATMDLVTQLKKTVDSGNTDDEELKNLLESLLTCEMTLEILRETKVGKVANNLRRTLKPPLSDVAGRLVKKWKSLVPPKTSSSSSKSKAVKKSSSASTTASSAGSTSSSSSSSSSKSSDGGSTVSASDLLSELQNLENEIDWKTGIRMRDFVRRKFMEAFRDHWRRWQNENGISRKSCADTELETKSESSISDFNNHVDVACELESELTALCGHESSQFKEKFRDLQFNLSHKKNRDLGRRIINGTYTTRQVCEMSNSELASDSLQKQREVNDQYAAEAMKNERKVTAMTDQFKCGRCKQRKCSYYEQQTRGADEPMTTFITCTVCGNKWKM